MARNNTRRITSRLLKLRPLGPVAVAGLLVLTVSATGAIDLASAPAAPEGGQPEFPARLQVPGQAVRVIDGDTVEVTIDGRRAGVGLTGLNVAQGNTECGEQATERLESLVEAGVRLEADPGLNFDRKDRKLYRAVAGGKGVAEQLVADGVAVAEAEGKAKDQVLKAEQAAKAARKGCVWQRGNGAQPAVPLKEPTPALATPDSTESSAGGDAPARPGKAGRSTERKAQRDEAALGGAPGGAVQLAAAAGMPTDFVEETIAAGLENPTSFVHLPDGRILVSGKAGVVRVVKNGAVLPQPFIDISAQVNNYWDRGLVSIAADPNFATNGFVYLMYTYENDPGQYDGTKTGRLLRVTARGDTAVPGSEQVILGTQVGASCNDFAPGADCLPSDAPSHSVGDMRFAPDGTLFVTSGDGSSFTIIDDNAMRVQNLDSLAGKILRITPSGAAAPGNPFATGSPADNRSKVWAYGVRNAWRLSLRPGSNVPYVGDVQWSTYEEVNSVPRGSNLGWPCYEGPDPSGYSSYAGCQALYARGDARPPLHYYTHDGMSAAVTGGVFYTGQNYPAQYRGRYFYGDYAKGFIGTLGVDASDSTVTANEPFGDAVGGPVDFEMGPDGDLHWLDIWTGALKAIRYRGADVPRAPVSAGSCAPGQYEAQYFANTTLAGAPVLRRCESGLDIEWGTSGPGGGVPADGFSARWTGTHNFAGGPHAFTAVADDGMRVFIDGVPIVDNWKTQSVQVTNVTRDITPGPHQVTFEYFEGGGQAEVELTWRQGSASARPVPTITRPLNNGRYKVGDFISYTGTATDPEDGPLPASALSWQVIIQHCPGGDCHTHLLTSGTGATGGFTAPDHGSDSWLEVVLTATDKGGEKASTKVTLRPS